MTDRIRPPLGSTSGSLSDAAGFSAAVRPHLPRLVRLAARVAPAEISPDDVVQEALIRAWRYRASYDDRRGPVSSWLMRIVANEGRRAASRPRLPIAARSPGRPAAIEDRVDIDAAVQRLPPRQRLAVDCYYDADLSISETASVMDCSEGTVKSTLSDARERLRSILGGQS